MAERRAVVLAGGLGTRLRGVLPDLPKPLAPVNGKPFLEWVLLHLAANGIRTAVISTGYKSEAIVDWSRTAAIAEIRVSTRAEPSPQGTAGGFLHAVGNQVSGSPWLLCNGDTLVLANLSFLYDALKGNDAAVLGVRQADASRYGRLETDARGLLTGFVEKRPGAGLINAGVWLFSAALLSRFPKKRPLSLEADVVPRWLKDGVRIAVVPVDAPFIDIGIEETYAKATAFVESHSEAF